MRRANGGGSPDPLGISHDALRRNGAPGPLGFCRATAYQSLIPPTWWHAFRCAPGELGGVQPVVSRGEERRPAVHRVYGAGASRRCGQSFRGSPTRHLRSQPSRAPHLALPGGACYTTEAIHNSRDCLTPVVADDQPMRADVDAGVAIHRDKSIAPAPAGLGEVATA